MFLISNFCFDSRILVCRIVHLAQNEISLIGKTIAAPADLAVPRDNLAVRNTLNAFYCDKFFNS